MKVIISSYVRVGSTWVARMANILWTDNNRYQPLKQSDIYLDKNDQVEFFTGRDLDPSLVVKTHNINPCQCLSVVNKSEDVYCIIVRRNFLDTFLSKYLYEKNNRGTEKLPRSPIYEQLFTRYPNIPDDAGLNYLVEAHREFTRQEINIWYLRSRSIINPKYLIVDYDRCVNEGGDYLLDLLSDFYPTTEEKRDLAREACSFPKMKDSFQKDFVRKGKVGDWKNYYDQPSVNFIKGEINKIYNNLV